MSVVAYLLGAALLMAAAAISYVSGPLDHTADTLATHGLIFPVLAKLWEDKP